MHPCMHFPVMAEHTMHSDSWSAVQNIDFLPKCRPKDASNPTRTRHWHIHRSHARTVWLCSLSAWGLDVGWQHALAMSLPRNGYSKVSLVSPHSHSFGSLDFSLAFTSSGCLAPIAGRKSSGASDTCRRTHVRSRWMDCVAVFIPRCMFARSVFLPSWWCALMEGANGSSDGSLHSSTRSTWGQCESWAPERSAKGGFDCICMTVIRPIVEKAKAIEKTVVWKCQKDCRCNAIRPL